MFLEMKREQYLIYPINTFNLRKIDSEELIKCFDQIDSSKSAGITGFSIKILKAV